MNKKQFVSRSQRAVTFHEELAGDITFSQPSERCADAKAERPFLGAGSVPRVMPGDGDITLGLHFSHLWEQPKAG